MTRVSFLTKILTLFTCVNFLIIQYDLHKAVYDTEPPAASSSDTLLVAPQTSQQDEPSWIGNQWIPPKGQRLYHPHEMRDVFSRNNVLWIGDSTARRAARTLHAILNQTTTNQVSVSSLDSKDVIDAKKGIKRGYASAMPIPPSSSMHLYQIPCARNIADMLNDGSSWFWKDVSKFDYVIFSLGPWDLLNRCKSRKQQQQQQQHENANDRDKDAYDMIYALIQANFPKQTQVIYKTMGTVAFDKSTSQKDAASQSIFYARRWNAFATSAIDRAKARGHAKQLTYVDWGSVMMPRSHPIQERILGDSNAHYGLEARLALIQMLMNHLVSLEKRAHVT